jgi:tRNA-binding protein
VGEIVRAETFPHPHKPAWKVWVDAGDLGVKWSSAELTEHCTAESMVGPQVLAVVNVPPKQIADFISEILVLGCPTARGESCWFSPSAGCLSADASTDAHGEA